MSNLEVYYSHVIYTLMVRMRFWYERRMWTASWCWMVMKLCPLTSITWSPTCSPASSAGDPLSTLPEEQIIHFELLFLGLIKLLTLKRIFPVHTPALPSRWIQGLSSSEHEGQSYVVDLKSVAFHKIPLPSVTVQDMVIYNLIFFLMHTFSSSGDPGTSSVPSTGFPEGSTLKLNIESDNFYNPK